LHKYLIQKRFTRSISGHQETFAHFQDLHPMCNTLSPLKMVNPAYGGTDPIYIVLDLNFMPPWGKESESDKICNYCFWPRLIKASEKQKMHKTHGYSWVLNPPPELAGCSSRNIHHSF
jgi:hypothetical protein